VSRLLLDSTFLIDAERGAEDLDAAIDDDDDIAVAAITIAELRGGALLATGRRRAVRSAYVDEIAATIPVLSYDVRVAEAHAQLLVDVRRQGKPRGAHDLVIAATARATDRAVVTADRTAFVALTGVAVQPHR
jgi:tRNA(fMet)-specific endonuclease VapC